MMINESFFPCLNSFLLFLRKKGHSILEEEIPYKFDYKNIQAVEYFKNLEMHLELDAELNQIDRLVITGQNVDFINEATKCRKGPNGTICAHCHNKILESIREVEDIYAESGFCICEYCMLMYFSFGTGYKKPF
jgi:hypothetical protein